MNPSSNNLLKTSLFLFVLVSFRLFGQHSCEPNPCDGKTYTQGAWGACNNSSASQYLNSHFAASFPSGLTIGCNTKRLVLTSASAVEAFLPSGSTPSGLPTGTLTNPGTSYNNVLAGQLVTLILNATFDANNSGFSPSAIPLSSYTIASGPFSGMSVGNFITLANSIIGGCSSQYSYSQLNTAADNINNAYDNGNSNTGFLICEGACNITVNASCGSVSCFGGSTTVTVSAAGGTAPYTGAGIFTVTAGNYTYQVNDAGGCSASKTISITQPTQLLAASSSGTIGCNGSSANVTVTASGGTSPYTGTGVFAKPAGVHSFTVTDYKGCKSVTTRTVIQAPQLQVSATSGTISCYGGTTTVTITASGGTPPYDYNNCGSLTRQAGVHSFTVNDSKGCVAVVTLTITQPAQLIASNSSGTIACNGGATGITVTATGGTSPYVSGIGTFTALAGIKSFTVTDSKGCKSVTTRTLTQPSQLNASSTSCGNISCNGGTAAITVGASGGTPPYSGTGVFNKPAGIYTFTVTDAKGCTSVTTETLTQPNGFSITATAGTILCYGGSTTVTITASGGQPPYDYNTCGSLTRSAGVHTFTVTDSKGCTAVTTITITQPSQFIASASAGTIACNGGIATITVSAIGGTSPYVSGLGTFTALAGVRNFTVTDSRGCKATTSLTLTQPSKLIASSSSCGNISCSGGTAAITVGASGGTPPYTGTGVFNKPAGIYSFTVTDARGCISVTTETLTQPASFSITATAGTISCYGGSTTVTVTASGGQPPYSGCGNTFTRTAGVHTFTVTDNRGCMAVTTITITQPSQLVPSVSSGIIGCSGGSAVVTVTAIGGTLPYVSGTGNFTLSSGIHSFTVTDTKGCKAVATKTLTQPTPFTASSTCNANITCFGGTTNVNITANGGTPPYTNTGAHTVSAGPYSFTVADVNGCTAVVNGTLTQPSQLIGTASQGILACSGTTTVSVAATGGSAPYIGTGIYTVEAGPYSYTVTDAKGCTSIVTGTINQISPLTASASCNANIACYGGTTVVNITANGGTAPYTNVGTHVVFAGAYSYTVTDASGCTSIVSGTITQPSQLTTSSTQGTILCYDGTTTVNITATGGTSPYSGTGTFTLSAGPYSYTVTDANGCTSVVNGTITQPSQLTATANAGTILSFGGSTTVTVTANGGTSPYTGVGTFTASAGTHTYLVTDANGCSVTVTVTLTEPGQLIVTTTQGTILCNGGSTTVNIAATGGTAPYTGIGTFTASAGTHTYLVSDANNVTYVATVTITEPSSLVASSTQGNILCNGGTTTVNVSATGGTSPYTGTGIFTLSAGPYSYTVTDANGCTSVVSGTITQPSQLTATANAGTILSFGGSTTVTITANGGTAPYTGVGTFTASAGTHTYLVSDANGCSVTLTVTLTEPGQLVVTTTQGTILCNGGTTIVNITANGGTAPYSGIGTFTASAGTQTYLVSDANNVTYVATVTITEPSSLVASSTQGNILCNGGTTTVNVSATGGTTPYTGTGIYTLNAGPYSYTVTDVNGCTSVVSGTITQPSQLTATANAGIILSFGGSTTVTITANGGTSPYTGVGTFTASAGTHTYLVTDANGCSVTVTITLTEPGQLVVTTTQGAILCNGGSTTVNIVASGGTAPYTGIGTFTASAGTQTYLVSDANNVTYVATVTITQPSPLVASSTQGNILCNGGTTTVNITATGGTAPYTGTGIYTLSAGPYSYTVTDTNGCTSIVSGTITQPSQLTATANAGTILSFGGSTTVTITANGGTAPYTGVGTFTASAGTHTYLVTDANGCSVTVTITLTEPGQLVVTTTQGTILCNGGTTTVNIVANGGTAPYTGIGTFTASAGTHTYLVSDANDNIVTVTVTIAQPSSLVASSTQGNILCNGGTTTVNITATGGTSPYTGTGIYTLSAGPYSYTVTDANGCTSVVNGTITQPSQLTATANAGTILSFGGSTTVTITANGGTAPYTGVGTFTASAGTHTYLVTDANGCSVTVTITLTEPGQLVVTTTQGTILCNGGTTTVNITATGGTAPYTGIGTFTTSAGTNTYLVSDANNVTYVATVTISQPSSLVASSTQGNILCNGGTTTVNVSATGGTSPYIGTGIYTLSAGPYSYTVTDANGCNSIVSGTITQPSQLTATANAGAILSFGGSTTVTITANGGTAPYSGVGTFTASAGTHTYLVTDANGCSVTVTVTLTEPGQLVVTTTQGTILCNGGTTTVNITATGGTAPYTGIGTFTASAGTHTYLVSDANNVTYVATVTITQPSQLVASASTGIILCNGGTTTVNITATGGTSPYTGVGVFTLSAGPYSYTVTDANGCTSVVSGTITQPSQLTATANAGTILNFGGSTTVTVTANGGTAPYSGVGTFTASAGTHTYLVTDANGCSVTVTVTLTEPGQLVVTTTQGTILCNGGTTTVNVTATGGTAPYSGLGTFTASAGTHTYLVSDANNVTYVATVTITQPSQLVASAGTGIILCNGGTTTVNVSATGGTSPYTGTGIYTLSAGPYSYTVTDANGCTSVVSGTITQPSQLIANATAGTILSFGGSTTVTITANGGTAPYSGVGTFTASAGTHTYLVTDANGCSVTVTVTLTEPGQLVVTTTQGTILCNGGTTTVNITATGGTAPYTGIGTFTASAGTHTYLVSDANNVTYVATVTITQPSSLVASSIQGTILCSGGTTTVNVSAAGGTSPYIGTGIYTLNAGPYSYTVTDVNGCTSVVSGTITQPSSLVVSSTQGNILCNGGTTTVNVTATGGTSPYTGTGTFTLSAGPYSYTVTDANGCTSVVNGTITQPSQLTATANAGSILSFGGSTTVTVTANGGTSSYTGVGTFTASAGTHTYLVTDVNGCSVTVTVTLTEPGQLVVTTTQGTILCNGGSTTVNIAATGGTAPYTGIGTFTASAGTNTYLVSDANDNMVTVTVTISQPSQLTASSTQGTILCNGGTTTVNITATGGTSPYTGVGIFTLSAGPYSYTVTDANGCTSVVSGTITQPSQLTATANAGTILSFGGSTTVTITANGGTSPYTGVGTFTASAGTHTYLVTDANGCSVTVTITLTEPGQLVVTTTQGAILCNGGSTTVNIVASGGTAPYTGIGTFTASAGTQTYLVSDANNVTYVATVTITQPSPLVASSTQGNILCNGGTTTVNVSATGGTSPYTGTGIYTLSSGPYSYTVTDANGCTSVASGTITQPSQLTATANAGTILSFGGSTTVTITANGGTAPYIGVGTFTASAGTHTYLVTDANGCSVTVTVTLTEPGQLVVTTTQGTILCNGGSTTVNIAATGGTAPYTGIGTFTASAGTNTYLVSDANDNMVTVTVTISQPSQLTTSSTQGTILCNGGTTTVNITATGGTSPYTGVGIYTLSSGPYSYTVTDANGCTSVVSGTITQPSQLTATANAGTILSFGGSTTVTITATGGTAPYSGVGTFTASAGTHTYLVTDANGCSVAVTITLTEPGQLVVTTTQGTILCNGGSTTVNIAATGGTAPYTGIGTFTASAGTQTYLVSDANNVTYVATVTITEPSFLVTNATQGTVLCNGGTTTVNVSATGGTSPYIGTGIYTLSAGPYSYTVTDANGCTSVVSGTITQPSQLTATANAGTILSFGGSTTVTIAATGGTSPYTGVGTFTASAGTHTYLVTDANGCSVTVTITLTEPGQLVVTTAQGTILCNGGSTTVNITATGGTAPYTGIGTFTASAGTQTYLVSDANNVTYVATVTITQPSALVANASQGTVLCSGGTTTVNVSATGGTSPYTGTGIYTLSAGPYSYTVTDANGCTSVASGTITQPSQLVASASTGIIHCNGGTTTVNIAATGGTSPYTGVGVFTLNAGPYSYTVTDVNGCTSVVSGTITQPSQLTATANAGTILSFGGSTTVTIAATGGTAPYTGVGTFTASAGTHTYLVSDANGCSVTVTVTLTEPGQLVVITTQGTILCNGGTTTVNITASGGTALYTGIGTFTASAGTHTYLVSDANNVTYVATVTITEPSSLVTNATQGTILCNGGTTTVNVSATGGTSPYIGTGIYTLSAGPYSYTVTDVNGCTSAVNGTITQPSQLTATANAGTILSFGGSTTVTITANGGTGPYSGVGTFTAAAGTHTYLVTDANGCSVTVTVTLTEPGQLVVTTAQGAILCNGGTTTVNITANGGTAPYTGIGTFTASAGTHTYLVSDANNVTYVATVTITEPSSLVASLTQGNILCNGGTTTVNVSAAGGTSPYTGAGIFTLSAGPYSYTVTDANGCASVVNGTITQPSQLTATANAGAILSFGGSTTVTITATGGTAPYNGVGTFTASAGTYTYLVTDANGCFVTVTITLTEPGQLVVTTTQGTILCNGGTTTVNITATGGTAPYTGIGTFTASAGTHTYLVSDANNVTYVATVTITEPSSLVTNASQGTVLCSGGTTTVNVSATGGTSPYTGTGIYTLSAGPYSYTVTDANGCASVVSGTITQPSQLTVSSIQGTILCNGGTTTVNVSATGGTSPYTGIGIYTLSAGPYSYTVTDANGCISVVNGTITQPSQLTATANAGTILSFGGSTTVTITATGGTAPYSGVGTFTASAGTHTYLVTDANGCSVAVTITLTEPGQLVVTTAQGTILCNGGSTTVNITATGGTAPYTGIGTFTASAGTHTYLVSDANNVTYVASVTITQPSPLNVVFVADSILCNGGNANATITATGGTSPYSGTGVYSLASGSYTYFVTDANGCSAFAARTITEPSSLLANFVADTIHCNGGLATISVTASGGATPYLGVGSYTVPAGTYNYSVTDANGCSSSSVLVVAEPASLDLSLIVTANILCSGDSASIVLLANGGTAPYSGTGNFNVSVGTHSYVVTDAMGCSTSTSVVITGPTSPLLATFVTDSILCNGGSANATISATGGTAPYSGIGNFILPPGAYTYQVTDANGCSAFVSRTVSEPPPLIASFVPDTIHCNGGFTTVRVTAWGGTAPYTGTGTYSVYAGTYNYSVIDTNGCSAYTVITLSEPPPLIAGSVVNSPILCHGGFAMVTVFATGGSGIYLDSVYNDMPCMNDSLRAMLAANGGTVPYWGPDTYPVPAGSYTYGVVDSHCCWDTAQIVIPEPPELIGSVLLGETPCYYGETTVTLTATGGTSPYTGTSEYTVTPGPYVYQVFDSNGCMDTVSFVIDGNPCVGLDENTFNGNGAIGVYPNPNNGTFRIAGAGHGKAVVMSQSGQLVRQLEFQDNEEIVVEELAEGVYFLVGSNWRVKLVVIRN